MTELAGPSRKGPAAFRTISEASTELGVPQHVLRFWETKFAFIRPMKRAGGRRFYRPQDLDVLRGVRALLQDDGYTIKGVQKLHKEQGLKRLVTASGVADAAAARLVAEMEAEAASQDAEASVETTRARAASDMAPGAGPRELSAAALVEDPDSARTGDLFDGAQRIVPWLGLEPEPRPESGPESGPEAEPELEPASQPPGPGSSRPVLDTAARRRLAEVLNDLETTKAGIDALLRQS